MEQFETPGHVSAAIRNPNGAVEVTAEGRNTTEVIVEALHPDAEPRAEATRVELTPDGEGAYRLVVEVPEPRGWGEVRGGIAVRIRIPAGADVKVRTASADVRGDGRLGRVMFDTASGDVWLQEAEGDARVSTASGDVNIRRVGGSLQLHTASGTVYIDEVTGSLDVESASGDQHLKRVAGRARLRGASADIIIGEVQEGLQAETASGDITVDDAAGALRLRAQSGDVEVRRMREGTVSASSTSGDVTVGVLRGARVRVDLDSRSGDVRSHIPLSPESVDGDGPLVEVEARTTSGDIRVAAIA
jgi:DUF4097 and DUF4098 domain-containing protein YvlB